MISYSTPLVIDGPRGPELVLNTSERVEAFDPATGKAKWHFTEPNRFPIPMPVFDSGVLYLNRGYRSSPYMAIRAGGEGGDQSDAGRLEGRERGPRRALPGLLPGIAVHGERIWDRDLRGCQGGRNGVARTAGRALDSASPAAADGKIYLLSETGEMLVLRAGRKAEVLARNDLGEQSIASPALSNGQIFLRTDRSLFAIGKAQR